MYRRWWVDSGVPKLIAMRERSIEYLLWGVAAADEVEFSSTRIALSKITTAATIVDDLFDDYATFDQLRLVKQAIAQGWDVSIIKNMPQNFKMCLQFVFKDMKELINEATQKQGRDMMPFITKAVRILLQILLYTCFNIMATEYHSIELKLRNYNFLLGHT